MTVRPSCPCLTDSSLAAPTLLLLRLELQVPIHAAAAAAATITSVCKEQTWRSKAGQYGSTTKQPPAKAEKAVCFICGR